ncbi:MAG TPA: hypothetical protein VH700_06350 [Gemmatimonadales bacterium]|jgi:hypothetical protein
MIWTPFTHRADNDYRLIYGYTVVAQYPNGHSFMLFGPGLGDGVVIPGNRYAFVLDGPDLAAQQLRGNLAHAISAVYGPGNVSPPSAEWPRTKGDEIFLAASVHGTNRRPVPCSRRRLFAPAHGEWARFPGRVTAGTIPGGGIQPGDMPDFTFVGVVNELCSSGGRYRVPIRIERLPDAPVQAVRRVR